MKQKILFIVTKDDTGGAQKYVRDLTATLDQNRFESKILFGGRDIPSLSNRIRPLLLFANDWFAAFALFRAFLREQPDIVHLNSSKAGIVGSVAAMLYRSTHLRDPKLHVVFTAHGWVFNPANHPSPIVRRCYAFLHRLSAYAQDAIICVSEFDRELALRFRIAPPRKLVTVLNGIDPDTRFFSREAARAEILKRLGKHSSELGHAPWVGSIGRLTKEKDYETLIRSAPSVPGAHFFIIGEGRELESLERTARDLQLEDRLSFVPPLGRDWELLKAFDAFALSSRKEGLPYATLEAMAAGVPVAATAAGGVPEIISRSSRGRIVSIGDSNALGAAITSLLGATPRMNTPWLPAEATLARMVERTADVYQMVTA
jgi:glycosyltransferase involved in cell wall biosynthesis